MQNEILLKLGGFHMTMFVIIINISDTPFDIEHLDFEWFLGTKFGF